MKLVLKDCTIEQLNRYPGEEGVTQVLKIKALLTRPLAGHLHCQGLCFADNGMPRRFEDFIKLPLGHMGSSEIAVGSGEAMLANEVRGFRVRHTKATEDGSPSIEVYCALHFDGGAPVAPWMDVVNKAQFTMTIKPPNDWEAQGELAFDEQPPAEDEDEPIEAHLQGEALDAHASRTGTLAPAAQMGAARRRKDRTQIQDPA